MDKRKYFMAVVLRGEAFEKAEAIKTSLNQQFGLKGALCCPAHITIHRPFEWPEKKEDQLIAKLGSFQFGPAFPLELEGFGSFGPRVLFIAPHKNDVLTKLHESLRSFARRELGLLNEWEDMRGFHPHVTVASRDLRKNMFEEVKSSLNKMVYHETIMIDQIVLLKLETKWEELRVFPFRHTP